jgi:hypothetical protein
LAIFSKKRKFSQFPIGEKVAKKFPNSFVRKVAIFLSKKKKESTGLGGL